MEFSEKRSVQEETARRVWEEAAAEAYLLSQAASRARKDARMRWDDAEIARTAEHQERVEKAADAWEAARAERIARAEEREAKARVNRAKDALDQAVNQSSKGVAK